MLAAHDDGIELEEAFATSTRLPGGFEAKAGYFLTEFGRANPVHAQASPWIDRSLPAARLLGSEGMRGPGARLAWLAPGDHFVQALVGVQNPDDPTMTSFLGGGHQHGDEGEEEAPAHGLAGLAPVGREPRGGSEFVWNGRLATAVDLNPDAIVPLDISGALGPNATGPDGRPLSTGPLPPCVGGPGAAMPGLAIC